MIVCTDSHSLPTEVLYHPALQNELGRRFVDRALMVCTGTVDIDQRWREMYNNFKDSTWPNCDKVEDFATLPLAIRKELKEDFNLELVHISNDYSSIHVDHPDIGVADLQHQEKSARHFCKVDGQVVNPQVRGMKMVYSTEMALAANLMTAWNDALHDVCSKNSFYDYTLWLPLQDIDVSIKELKRCYQRDFFGVWLDDRMPWAWTKEVEPLFKFCNDHKIPVYFHKAGLEDAPLSWDVDYKNPVYVAQRKIWPFDIFLENNVRWLANICSLITEGVLDRNPDLRIVIAEKGLEWTNAIQRLMLKNGYPDPMPYFKKHFWITTELEEPNFFKNAESLGWDRLLFATDYAHNDPGGDNRFKDVDMINSWLADNLITQEQYDLITHKNYLFLKARK